jgi:hypothetical protein
MKFKLFKDILKVNLEGVSKYSQGRVYLFIFVLCYLASLIYYMYLPNTMQTIIDSLQWAILLFAAYVFGDKGVQATKHILINKGNSPNQTPQSPADTTTKTEETISDMVPDDMSVKN